MADRILTEKKRQAAEKLLAKGERVELTLDKDGSLRMRTVYRKDIKI